MTSDELWEVARKACAEALEAEMAPQPVTVEAITMDGLRVLVALVRTASGEVVGCQAAHAEQDVGETPEKAARFGRARAVEMAVDIAGFTAHTPAA